MRGKFLPIFLTLSLLVSLSTSCALSNETANKYTLLWYLVEMCSVPSLVEKGMVRTPIGVPATVSVTNFETLKTTTEGDYTIVQLLTRDGRIMKSMIAGPKNEGGLPSATSGVNIFIQKGSVEAQLFCP